MTLLPSVLPAVGRNQLPPLKLPLIPYNRDEWLPNQIIYPTSPNQKDILLPPILTTTSPYSSCSSFPSSPDSASVTSFPSLKKGSIESLLNSGPELLALDSSPKKKKKRHAPYSRQMKGLRLFSKQVCDKVAEKGVTTYNQVADELAAEIQQSSVVDVDQKNIRRRVYDALNVLMALDIIAKDRKQIKWLGIPHQDDNNKQLLEEIQKEEERQQKLHQEIKTSQHALDVKVQHLQRLDTLISRNQQQQQQNRIYLPFFIVASDQPIETTVHCPNEASLTLGTNWSIYQDTDILAKLWPTTTVSS
jgi:hypothetical protein